MEIIDLLDLSAKYLRETESLVKAHCAKHRTIHY